MPRSVAVWEPLFTYNNGTKEIATESKAAQQSLVLRSTNSTRACEPTLSWNHYASNPLWVGPISPHAEGLAHRLQRNNKQARRGGLGCGRHAQAQLRQETMPDTSCQS